MRFEEPLWLVLVFPALAAAWASARAIEPRRAALAYPPALRLGASRAAAAFWRSAPAALKALALVLCAAALARPQSVSREFGALTAGVDIMLALDTSTSMLALDFSPRDRISVAKETAARFVGGRVSDRIGLVVFGGAPVLACPLTMDYESLLEYIEGVEANMTRVQGTAIGDAIAASVNHLKSSRAKSKVAILLTDGASNTGVIDPVTAARAAAGLGIKFYAIGTGRRGPAMIPVDGPFGTRQMAQIPDELDEPALMKVAEETGGKYFRATTALELRNIFDEIDKLEKTAVQRPMIVSYKDYYAWLVLPALLAVGLELLLARTLLFRLP